jgi:hypothetical protein
MRFPVNRFRRLRSALLAVAVGSSLVVPQVAFASGNDVWNDCGDADGAITRKHSQSDYSDALKNPPADGAEYSNCLDLIRQAQIRDANTGSNPSNPTGGGTGNPGGGNPGGSAVAPADLSSALKQSGVDPSQPATGGAAAPAPVTVDGKQIDLAAERVPSIASALSLPLPLAASAVVVLLSAGMPLVRYVVARFGGPPTGTTSTTP